MNVWFRSVLVLGGYVIGGITGCSNAAGGDGSGGGSSQCKYTVTRALDFSSCESDNDCFSGYCCKPGVFGCGHQGTFPGYCAHPSTTAFRAGHGYSCETDQDCIDVAPQLVQQHVSIKCYKDNLNDVSNGCSFDCLNR